MITFADKISGSTYVVTHIAHVVAYLGLLNVHGAVESPGVPSPYCGTLTY